MTRPKPPESPPALRKLKIMIVLTVVVGASFVMMFNKGTPASKGKAQASGGGQPAPAVSPTPAPAAPVKAPAPLPASLLTTIQDGTLLDEAKHPVHDRLRAYIHSYPLALLDNAKLPALDAAALKADAGKAVALRGALVEVTGQILDKVEQVELTDRPSKIDLVYRGRLRDDSGQPVAFELINNPHAVRKKERITLRGVFYKLAAINKDGEVTVMPFVIAEEAPLDRAHYIKKIRDGKTLESGPYWVLVRQVQWDRRAPLPTVPVPTPEQLADLGFCDTLRGQYVTVTGTLEDVRRREGLDGLTNRAFLDNIWEGRLRDDSGRIWLFDLLKSPKYMPFLKAHKVKLTGAFAKLLDWQDAGGKEQRSPYLVARTLTLAEARPPFKEIPDLIGTIEDGSGTHDVTYQYLLHRLSQTDDAAIAAALKPDYTLADVVTKEKRNAMRGQMIEVKGRLLRTQAFELSDDPRLNPSGVRKMWQCFIATGTLTIYTVDVIEEPKGLREGRDEVTVRGAFWKVWAFPTRERGKSNKSPYVIGRRLVKRQVPTADGLDQFQLGAVILIGVILVFLIVVGSLELRKAGQWRVQMRQAARARAAARTSPESSPAAEGGAAADPATPAPPADPANAASPAPPADPADAPPTSDDAPAPNAETAPDRQPPADGGTS